MNVILLGAPGAGKGTQAKQLSEKYNIPHISTGDIFRANIKNGTEIGKVAKSYIDKGQLVPDEVTVEIVRQRLCESDCQKGFLLDGFPRNLFQAEQLDTFAKIDKVVNIEVDFSSLLNRITGRRVCPKCGESYHVDFLNGKTGCLKCGQELIQRADDNKETVENRLNVYSKQTEPLISFYKEQGKLVVVNGDKPINEVFKDVCKNLD